MSSYVYVYTCSIFIFHSDVQSHVLTIEDLLPYSTKLSHKLLPLGVALGIKDYAKGILAGNGTPEDKCIMILDKWLEVTAHPTWKDFCEKLEQPGLEMVNLANELKETHCLHSLGSFGTCIHMYVYMHM